MPCASSLRGGAPTWRSSIAVGTPRPRRPWRKFARWAGALALKTDLADAAGVGAAIDRAAAELGRLDILVQAAGAMGAWRETAELSTDDWDRYLAVDLSGAFYAIRATLPHLRKAGGGAIVAISSIAAQMCQARNVQGAAAKAGLEAIVRVVAREEGRRGIRANAVAVGLTDTEMGRAALAAMGTGDRRTGHSRHPAAPDRHARRGRARRLLSGRARRAPTSPARCCKSMADKSSRREAYRPDQEAGAWRSTRG